MSAELSSGARPVGLTSSPWAPRGSGASPLRKYAGFAVVLLLHVLFIWALKNGLATKVVQVIEKPIETKIIEPIKPPPPPPVPVVTQPPPKVKPPPAPFVPKPEVHVQAPPVATIVHQADPVPTPVAPPPEAAPPAPPAPAKPVSHEVGVVCPNAAQVRSSIRYPAQAQDNGITGEVVISFVVDEQGHVTEEKVDQSADPDLDRAAFNAVKKFNCISQGQSVRVQVPFAFSLS